MALTGVWPNPLLTRPCLSSSLFPGGPAAYQNCVKSLSGTSSPSAWHQASVLSSISVRLLGKFQFSGIQCFNSLTDKGWGREPQGSLWNIQIPARTAKETLENWVPPSGN